jgi:hypothetical protein
MEDPRPREIRDEEFADTARSRRSRLRYSARDAPARAQPMTIPTRVAASPAQVARLPAVEGVVAATRVPEVRPKAAK